MEALLGMLPDLLAAQLAKVGWAGQLLMIVGGLRVLLKPLMSVVQAYVQYTVSPDDDAMLAKFMDSPVYKGLAYVLDWFASIKLPKKE